MQVPRGNVEIGKMGGADQAPPFGSTLSQQPQQTHQKNPDDASLWGNLGKEFQVRVHYGPSPSAPPDMSRWQEEEALSNAEENCVRKATFE
jgi:hypothetical protein